MWPIRRILVAIKNPAASSLPAVVKAEQLARALGARIELFHGIDAAIYVDVPAPGEDALRQLDRTRHAQCRQQLEAIAVRLRRGGLEVSTAAESDYPAAESIVRRAIDVKADLIVAECHAGRRLAPWLLDFTDWGLLHLSHVPVLLVKSPRWYHCPAVLAAVDPTHSFAKPLTLDDAILKLASELTHALSGTLHAVHAYTPTPGALVMSGAVTANTAAEVESQLVAQARARFERALRYTDVRPEHRHLIGYRPIDAIQRAVRTSRCSLLVMGAVSRTGLERVFIGNTAERILDRLECDVLVVKPPQFRYRVSRRRRGPRFVSAPLMA